jgi:hypothetical protein
MRSHPKLRLVAEQDQEAADFDAVNVDDDKRPPPRRSRGPSFTMFSDVWRDRLRTLNKASLNLALLAIEIQRKAYAKEFFPVTDQMIDAAGIPRQHKARALRRLETLGLIEIEWRGRRSPIVTPLFIAGRRRSGQRRGDELVTTW